MTWCALCQGHSPIPFSQTNGQAICWLGGWFRNGLGNLWSDRYHLCLRRLGSGCHPPALAAWYGMHVLIGRSDERISKTRIYQARKTQNLLSSRSLVKIILHKGFQLCKGYHALTSTLVSLEALAIVRVNFRLLNYYQSFIKHLGVLQGAMNWRGSRESPVEHESS